MGELGEQQAVIFLQRAGYIILEKNVRSKHAEIDIIAWDTQASELVFVEVKTRSHAYFGHPSQAVNRCKLRSLQSVAHQYCFEHHINNDYRFDLITILPEKIEHYHNITWGMVK